MGLCALLLAAPLARAQDSSPSQPPAGDDSALVDQYREDVPTTTGPSGTRFQRPARAGSERQAPARAELPLEVRAQLDREAGPDAPLLERVATAKRYGAPQVPVRHGGRQVELASAASSERALSAAVTAVGDARPVFLLAALLVVTAAALAAAGYSRRRAAQSDESD
ncbi:MAG: hypothetical protein M3312_11665 [Actinomycetota bacterium]|nr:hypothetical protein [Actinomycetota bacterium]